MSEKKTTGTVYTITEEQKNKIDKQAAMLAKMEAGKTEIMKLVEGVPGA